MPKIVLRLRPYVFRHLSGVWGVFTKINYHVSIYFRNKSQKIAITSAIKIMASKQIFNILKNFKSSYNFKNPLSIVPHTQPSNIIFVRNASTAYTSYTKERKLNENFKPRWKKCAAIELNRRRAKVAIDEKLRYGHEKIVRRSQFTDWNYPAEISAFQARLSEQFDEDKLLQSFKTREYLEDLTMQRRITFGVENDNIYSHNNG